MSVVRSVAEFRHVGKAICSPDNLHAPANLGQRKGVIRCESIDLDFSGGGGRVIRDKLAGPQQKLILRLAKLK